MEVRCPCGKLIVSWLDGIMEFDCRGCKASYRVDSRTGRYEQVARMRKWPVTHVSGALPNRGHRRGDQRSQSETISGGD